MEANLDYHAAESGEMMKYRILAFSDGTFQAQHSIEPQFEKENGWAPIIYARQDSEMDALSVIESEKKRHATFTVERIIPVT